MRRLVVAGFVLVLVGLSLYSQTPDQKPFVVQYLDGSVQVQLKGQTAWVTLKTKAVVPANATVKLAKGAMVELARDKTVISLIKDGIYPMTGLVSKLAAADSGLGASVAAKISRVAGIGGVKADGQAVMGVKAPLAGGIPDWSAGGYTKKQKEDDEKAKAESVKKKDVPKEGFEIDNLQFFFWGIKGAYAERENPRMYEEYKDAIDQGIRKILESKYAEAIESMRNAVTEAIFDEEVRRANYLLAVAYVEAGFPARAWKIISGLNVMKEDLEYADILIRKAQLQVDAFQYEDAVATLKPLLEPLVNDEFGQAACLVAYYAYKGLNRPKEASDVRLRGLSIPISGNDVAGNQVAVETETERILKSLE